MTNAVETVQVVTDVMNNEQKGQSLKCKMHKGDSPYFFDFKDCPYGKKFTKKNVPVVTMVKLII